MADYLPFTRPTLDQETIDGVVEVLKSGWITTGPQVERFEVALADYVGGDRQVRALTSATGALELALVLAGVGPGDEVIVPAMTFAASANVVVRVGAKPVFVDVDLDTRNLLLDAVETVITPKTRAIMPVHFAGLPVDLDRIYALAEKHDLRVIEDAAHAIGSSYNGKRIGSFGDLVCFSFHANKNMTTIEGAAVSVADADAARQLELLRFHGITKLADGGMDVSVAAGKHNMTDVSARIGLSQLARLDEFNGKRRALVKRYFDNLGNGSPVRLPAEGDDGHSWHMFAPLVPFDRIGLDFAGLRDKMHAQGIGIGRHYPAVPLFSLYRDMGYRKGQFPNAERIGRETVTLPLFPAMQVADVDRVCDALRDILGAG
ncbi:MAG TPA: DegT/DnrJ/EryC1/StrS aminotransferase family protein [Gammaproteobacteria bacterium]|nr:DegT/DnrJ/EryC1/StrS aminotransferase family protein [Gammaproteobacteria bacterium]